jgi:hypothetical protein
MDITLSTFEVIGQNMRMSVSEREVTVVYSQYQSISGRNEKYQTGWMLHQPKFDPVTS